MDTKHFRSRQATISDIGQLVVLFDAYRVFYGKESDLISANTFLQNRIANDESVVFIVENAENMLLGFVQLYPLFSSTRMKRMWVLNDLFVGVDYRGCGISKLLIESAKYHCRVTDACSLILETAKSNEIGNCLYSKTGFEIDIKHNYYEWIVSGY